MPPVENVHPFNGQVVFDAPTTWGFGKPTSYGSVKLGVCHLGIPLVSGPISEKMVKSLIILEVANCNRIREAPTKEAAVRLYDPNLHSYGMITDSPLGELHSTDYNERVHQPHYWRRPFENWQQAQQWNQTWTEVDTNAYFAAVGGPKITPPERLMRR
jgi:hypothetical protein